jgi:hypothetical protein
MKVNYQVIYTDYIQNNIYETDEPVDESLYIYSSFSEAKKKLLEYLRGEKKEIQERIYEIKSWKKEQKEG